MRPAGGYTPDMMDYAHSLDVYQIYADMVAYDERRVPEPPVEQCCAYAGRRDEYEYVHSHEEIMEKYGDRLIWYEPPEDAEQIDPVPVGIGSLLCSLRPCIAVFPEKNKSPCRRLMIPADVVGFFPILYN